MRCVAWLVIGGMMALYRGDLPRSSGAGRSAEGRLSQMPPGSASPSRTVRRKLKEQLPSGQDGFDQLWKGHPHASQASQDVREAHGLPDSMEHTCAIRLSIMLNSTRLTITPEKTQAAGREPLL